MSVRDGRKMPFIWASLAALDHLREHWGEDAGVRPSVGRSVYYALCEIANEDRARERVHEDSGAFRTTRKRISELAGVSDKPVDRALRELERIGLLSVERAEASGSRPGSPSAYTIHEPPETCGEGPHVEAPKRTEKVRTSCGPSPHVGTEKVRTAPHIGKKGKKEKAAAAGAGEFSPILSRLDAVAFARRVTQPKVPAAIRVCTEFADRDLAAEVEKFAHYWIDGPGEKRALDDVVWRWRHWLERSRETSAQRPRGSARDSVTDDLRRLEAEAERLRAEEAREERAA